MTTVVKFNSKKHKYTQGSKELTSVTKFISKFFPEFDAKTISKRVAKYRRNKGELNDKGKPINALDVRREWKAISDRGSLVHKEVEDYCTDPQGLEGLLEVFDKKSVSGVDFVKKELSDKNNIEFDPEVIVYSTSLGLAGTIDLMVSYDGEDGSRLVDLVDWKTNNKLKGSYGRIKEQPLSDFNISNSKLSKYYLQLNLYKKLLQMKGVSINDMFIVHLQDDCYEKYRVPDYSDVVDSMLEYEEDEND